ncbi:MAG TPA: DUF222 domain-containing protein [Povalibacter sp.]|nr:DUF222 domain-containing protein [Povalibacter sp.]
MDGSLPVTAYELTDPIETAPAEAVTSNSLSRAELASQITELMGHLNAANYRLLKLIAEFDRREGWSDWATKSCAHWLNWQCGIGFGAAREKVRTAHALESLPQLSAAMQRGELSYSKVRELTRVATPQNEDFLLMIGRHGTAQHVEKMVRCFRHAKEAEELSREALQQAKRSVWYRWATDGSLLLHARLPAETGAMVLKALDAAMDEGDAEVDARETMNIESEPQSSVRESESGSWEAIRRMLRATYGEKNVPPGTSAASTPVQKERRREPFATRRADALGRVAESFLAHGSTRLKGGDKYQIVVHVDQETLAASEAGRCEFEHGPALAAETARRLSCEASRVTLTETDQGEPLNVGRKTRTIPPTLQRALKARDRGCCRFPGCANTRFVDAHHVQHWAQGGDTKLSNLVTLCRFHHHAVHEGGVQIVTLDDGALRFVRPDGTALDTARETHGTSGALIERHRELGLGIDPDTATTLWRGEVMDYGMALDVLFQREASTV